MAGAFVLGLLVEEQDLFDNYIAASPVIQMNDSKLLVMVEQLFNKNKQLSKSLYFSLGAKNAEGKRTSEALNKFVAILYKSAPETFAWHYQYMPEQVHMTTPYLTIYQGLTNVFSDYKAPRFANYHDYQKFGAMKGLEDYYKKRGDKYMISTDVPESTVRSLGFALRDDEPEHAVNIFLANSKKHPESVWAVFALARGYESIKEKEKAMQAYKNALALAEKQSARGVDFIKREIERYKNDPNSEN